MSNNDNISSLFAESGQISGQISGSQMRPLFAPSKTAKEDIDLTSIFSDYFLEDWTDTAADMPQTGAPVAAGEGGEGEGKVRTSFCLIERIDTSHIEASAYRGCCA